MVGLSNVLGSPWPLLVIRPWKKEEDMTTFKPLSLTQTNGDETNEDGRLWVTDDEATTRKKRSDSNNDNSSSSININSSNNCCIVATALQL
jgi:hypothetical protein